MTHPAGMKRLAISVFTILAAATMARGDDAAVTDAPTPAFEPGDIAVGEPIPLPYAAPRTETPPSTPATVPSEFQEPRSLLTDPGASAANPSRQARGTGWIGLQVAEATEPGRWAITEVAVGGPAATAGIAVGDEVRAIDGVVLRSAEDAAQALTALAAGQRVSLAMARAGQPLDISLVAVERPVALSSRTWQSSQEPPPAAPEPAAAPSFDAPPPPFAAAPRFVAPAPEPAGAISPPAAASPQPRASPLPAPAAPSTTAGRTALGVRTVPIDQELQSRFNLPDAAGAYVIGVVQDLPASRAGVPPGSVIVALDNRPVRSPDELTRLVTAGPVGRPVTLQYILPGGASHRADVVLQSLERPLEAALIGHEPLSPTPAPRLQSGPTATTSRRLESGGTDDSREAMEASGLATEIRDLRARLQRLEERLDAIRR